MPKKRKEQPPQESKQPAARKRAPAAVFYGNHPPSITTCLFCDAELIERKCKLICERCGVLVSNCNGD